jgi:hypothetical protein
MVVAMGRVWDVPPLAKWERIPDVCSKDKKAESNHFIHFDMFGGSADQIHEELFKGEHEG